MIKVYDDFFPLEYANFIEDKCFSENIQWTYNKNTYGSTQTHPNGLIDPITPTTLESHQFVNLLDEDSDILVLFKDVIKIKTGFDVKRVKRVKMNMMVNDYNFKPEYHNRAHTDAGITDSDNMKVLLYYVNNSDGDTYFFNEYLGSKSKDLTLSRTMFPIKNFAVLFDAKRYHASSPPRLNPTRVVINYVFESA